MQSKICTVCKEDKRLDQYRKYGGRGMFGLRPLCKLCQRAYEMKWRSQNKERRRIARAKRSDASNIYSREYRALNRAKYLIAECRRRSAKKNIPFDLDQHIAEIQSRMSAGVCEVSGYPLDLVVGVGRAYNTPSIDRISASAGYVLTNIRIVAFAVNAMMGNWGEEVAKNIMRTWLKKEK